MDTAAGGDTDSTDQDEDDDWGLSEAEDYVAPMVVPDMAKRSEDYGYTREPHEQYRWTYYNLTAARLNPLGLVNRFRTGLRIQLSDSTEKAYFDSYINHSSTPRSPPPSATSARDSRYSRSPC